MTNVERFKQIVSDMADTYKRKNADYGNSFETTLDKWGPKVALARIEDKLNRVSTLIDSPAQVKDEAIDDTLMDLATYAIMFKMWWEKQSQLKVDPVPTDKTDFNKEDCLYTMSLNYMGRQVPARKGLNSSGYAPTQILGEGTIVKMDIKGETLHVRYEKLHRGSKTVGSGTMDAYYPLDDLATYGFTA